MHECLLISLIHVLVAITFATYSLFSSSSPGLQDNTVTAGSPLAMPILAVCLGHQSAKGLPMVSYRTSTSQGCALILMCPLPP